MRRRTRPFTPAEMAARRAYYADWEKRMGDAVASQYGIVDEDLHPDGLHRLEPTEKDKFNA